MRNTKKNDQAWPLMFALASGVDGLMGLDLIRAGEKGDDRHPALAARKVNAPSTAAGERRRRSTGGPAVR